ncbi:MAG TPA: alkaline phosphatase D family protein [Gemmatimonadaceae bacterium]|nr:alkaline phosphatase D family protein [Gemmatimonadaceae bacterium]
MRKHYLTSPSTRREFVADSLRSAAALVALGNLPARRDDSAWHTRAYPFTLGVASGDPLPDGFVAWTRLAPDHLGGGGMPARPVPVRYEIASDDSFRQVVQRGEVLALPDLAHSVHVEVAGLAPAREYFYRFIAGADVSPVGRAVTAPVLGAAHSALRFAFASCQHYEHGYFTAYRHLVNDNVDLVVHLGDYIYEYGIATNNPNPIRRHDGEEIITLAQYRNRFALYKSDRDLQNAHASAPFIVTWDDHEVENNYANAISENNDPPEQFLKRRAAAYQAYYEHLPLRRTSMPSGREMRVYRRVHYGNLAEFNVLDSRQYRSDQPCADGRKPRCPEAFDPNRTLLGKEQEKWLLEGLGRSTARWNLLANQVVMGDNMIRRPNETADTYPLDTWNGYVAERQRILDFLATRKPSNPVVLTGDIHVNIAMDLRADWSRPTNPTVGVELVGTSISSGGDGQPMTDWGRWTLQYNPHMKYFDARRGYVLCNVTRDRLSADYRIVPLVTRPGGGVETAATFVVENGKPMLQKN